MQGASSGSSTGIDYRVRCALLAAAALLALAGLTPANAGATQVIASAATAVTSGTQHDCALVQAEGAACWGEGSLGTGSLTSQWSIQPVSVGLADATAIDAGISGGCALVTAGAVKCWGTNMDGQIGDGTYENRTFPTSVQGLSGAIAISAGGAQACALLAGGTVKCWGDNYYGQLGDGSENDRPAPVQVSGLTGAVAISAGNSHTCALLAGGTIECWGANEYGELGDGEIADLLEATPEPHQVVGIENAVAVSAGGQFSCAVLETGAVKCWGYDGEGQLGDGKSSVENPFPVSVLNVSGATAVAAGAYHACALIGDGSVRCWGSDGYGDLGNEPTSGSVSTAVSVAGLDDATAVSTGYDHTCVLRQGGVVECWGETYGAREIPGSGSTQQPPSGGGESQAAPEVRITSHPPAETADTGAAFGVAGVAGGSYQCSIDAGGWSPCHSGDELGPLQPGDHRFRVRESLGGVTGPAASYSWTIDLPRVCVLRVARARVFASSRRDRARLVIHYKTYRPAAVTVSYRLAGSRGTLSLGSAASRFQTAGIFRLPERLTTSATAKLRAATSMTVRFQIPAAPDSCARYYTKRLTIPKRVAGQTVWFQSDSVF